MSYCRFSEADVYVYMDVGGYLCCCACPLGTTSFHADSTRVMVDHLAQHAAAGHDFPAHVIPELWADDTENFPT